ncbi:erythropoietin receptor [Terrapene carolina triunguis]|uniref:erythropoietin receptor n=1 Tax=Terrapene triunguis TaxID=2587831 RepID=UPI0011565601|nr:erythropoietin receptor [Terrapene carolina triunguis]
MFHALPGGPDLLLGEQQPPERHGIRLLLRRGGGRPTALQRERGPDALEQHPLQLRLPPPGHPVLHPPARRRIRRQQQQRCPRPHHHDQPSGSPGASNQPDGARDREPGAAGGELAAARPALPGEQPALRGGLRPRGRRAPDDLDPLILSLSLILLLIVVLLALFALLTHRRFLKKKLWPVIPSPEHKFEGLFTLYKGNFQLWLGQRNAYLWWSANPGYLEEQPTMLEVLSEGRESKAEGPVPPLPPKAHGSVPPARPEPPVEPQDDYLVLDEQLMPCSLGKDSLLLPDARSSASSEAPPAMGQELGPPGATPEPVLEERVSSSSSFEYTIFDPSSELLAPCGHQRPLKYSYLLVSDSGISADYSPLGTSTHQPNLYTNLCQEECQAQPFPASYVVCS